MWCDVRLYVKISLGCLVLSLTGCRGKTQDTNCLTARFKEPSSSFTRFPQTQQSELPGGLLEFQIEKAGVATVYRCNTSVLFTNGSPKNSGEATSFGAQQIRPDTEDEATVLWLLTSRHCLDVDPDTETLVPGSFVYFDYRDEADRFGFSQALALPPPSGLVEYQRAASVVAELFEENATADLGNQGWLLKSLRGSYNFSGQNAQSCQLENLGEAAASQDQIQQLCFGADDIVVMAFQTGDFETVKTVKTVQTNWTDSAGSFKKTFSDVRSNVLARQKAMTKTQLNAYAQSFATFAAYNQSSMQIYALQMLSSLASSVRNEPDPEVQSLLAILQMQRLDDQDGADDTSSSDNQAEQVATSLGTSSQASAVSDRFAKAFLKQVNQKAIKGLSGWEGWVKRLSSDASSPDVSQEESGAEPVSLSQEVFAELKEQRTALATALVQRLKNVTQSNVTQPQKGMKAPATEALDPSSSEVSVRSSSDAALASVDKQLVLEVAGLPFQQRPEAAGSLAPEPILVRYAVALPIDFDGSSVTQYVQLLSQDALGMKDIRIGIDKQALEIEPSDSGAILRQDHTILGVLSTKGGVRVRRAQSRILPQMVAITEPEVETAAFEQDLSDRETEEPIDIAASVRIIEQSQQTGEQGEADRAQDSPVSTDQGVLPLEAAAVNSSRPNDPEPEQDTLSRSVSRVEYESVFTVNSLENEEAISSSPCP